MNKITKILLCLFALMFALSPLVGAIEPYATYTYAKDGTPRISPTAYSPVMNVDSNYMGLDVKLDDPRDLFVDCDDNVYIVDEDGNEKKLEPKSKK